MSEMTAQKNLKEKLEEFLTRACEAEAKGEQAKAERLFRLAVFCEGKLCPDVVNAKEYVEQVMG